MTRNQKGWLCPYCSQTSSRHWNLEIHIKRKHNGIGHPIEAGLTTNDISTNGKFASDANRMKVIHPVSSRVGLKKEESRTINSSDNLLQDIRKNNDIVSEWIKFQNLSRISSSSQQDILIANLLMSQFLSTFSKPFSKPKASQNSTNITTNNANLPEENNGLPVGYRIVSCNRCVSENRLEPIFTSVEAEALTKVINLCDLEHIASKEDQCAKNSPIFIKQRQNDLIFRLREAVDLRVSLCQEEEEGDATLKIQEIRSYQSVLPYMQKIKLPGNKLWIGKEEDLIDLGNMDLNNIEHGKHWVCRAIKENGAKKITKLDRDELVDFLNITKSTFGAFRIKTGSGVRRYFLMSLIF